MRSHRTIIRNDDRRPLGRRFAASLVGVLLCSVPAAAQNELGGGRALDASFHALDGRYNRPRSAFVLNDINNAIVTGNVAGGKHFRGNVGYAAAGDFRASSGSDRYYRFRADSYYSGVTLLGVRPLQVYRNPQMGRLPNSNQMSAQLLARSTSGTDLSSIAQRRFQLSGGPSMIGHSFGTAGLGGSGSLQEIRAVRQMLQDYNATVLGSLSVPGAYSPSSAQPLQTYTPQSQQPQLPTGQIAPLALPGISNPTMASAHPRSAIPEIRPVGQVRAGNPAVGEQIGKATPGIPQVQGQAGNYKRGDNAHVDLLARMAAQASPSLNLPEPGTGYSPDLQKAIRDMNSNLRQMGVQYQPPAGPITTDEAPTAPTPGEGEISPADSITRLQEVVKSGGSVTIRRYSSSADEYIERLKETASGSLAEGRYFDAERRFRLAYMHSQQSDPLALAGACHAQVGAGLYVSAARNLRHLFTAYPEMLACDYDPALLPSAARLTEITTEAARSVEQTKYRDAGLLLAYLGHLSGNEAQVRAGIEGWTTSGADDPLQAAVRELWLGEDQAESQDSGG
ncbi:MAG: hypothetical protein D8M59_08310 [Planctomycetes bacterium]|nr:hypothetical protein [Planctomycetota bacterium]NOG54003.1 hypothetical protein [Planctomycetota bacterium]